VSRGPVVSGPGGSRVSAYDRRTMSFYDDEPPPPRGVVVERGRGSLPFALLHGEPLVACAAWAMGAAGILLLDLDTPWEEVRDAGSPLVWHDALCPMTPPDFLLACVRRAVAEDAVVAGVLPVTDTVKEVEERDGVTVVAGTRDRDRLRRLASPLVLPPSVVARLEDWPDEDLVSAVADLRARGPVLFADAPASAARVSTATDLAALEALTAR
jgi:2-C-methyl-D-erythritol 4-phosphate cytidylyltransferase